MDGPKLLGQAPQAQRTPWHALEAARKAFGLKLPCKLCQLKTPECPRGGVGFGMAGPEGKLLDGAALSLLGEARPGQLAGGGEARGQRNKKY